MTEGATRAPSLRSILTAAALALLLASPFLAAFAQDTVPGRIADVPPPVGFVNDRAGVLDESTRAKLEGFLDQVKQKTGVEFAVLVVPATAPESPSEYKVRVFESWKLGRQGQDDGLLMLVALREREVRFETGYGLEGTLPDGLQSRLFREVIRPRFRANDYPGGITAGVLAIAQRIAAEKGVTLEWDGRELRYSGSKGSRKLPGWVILFLVALLLLALAGGGGGFGGRGRRRRSGGWMLGPSWGGSFGGWGGSFGGGGFGGGSFGGGGGGGSFGGFGGGRSGGGGGGGSW